MKALFLIASLSPAIVIAAETDTPSVPVPPSRFDGSLNKVDQKVAKLFGEETQKTLRQVAAAAVLSDCCAAVNLDQAKLKQAFQTLAADGAKRAPAEQRNYENKLSMCFGVYVGLPGADIGLRKEDPTIAELLKAQGYVTGQFGKNHLGDKDEFLPTNHGFDEFYGNLYHLNAEEDPEQPDYPKEADFPGFRKQFGPRGVIHSFADGKVEDTGPPTKKRMETIDDDIAARAADFIERQHEAGKPMFVWVNFTHMHFRTHPKPESVGQAGRWQGEYHDVMIDHDKNVGTVLQKIDELGLADDTIVMYSTDNGPHMNSWPDAAMTPFRSEKNTNWEGAYRVPAMVRWPGKIKPGSVSNDIVSHLDWAPTLLAVAGVPDIKDDCVAIFCET